jgi:hypothetical protein
MCIEKFEDSTVLRHGQLLAVAEPNSSLELGSVQIYQYRRDPVPWVGRLKNCSLFRHPRTTSERRAYFSTTAVKEILESHGIAFNVRRKRSSHRLPNSWDDISPLYQRSWKKYRKTQRRDGGSIDRRFHSPALWDCRNGMLTSD